MTSYYRMAVNRGLTIQFAFQYTDNQMCIRDRTYPAGNDISTDITKYVLRDANGHPYGIDRDA